MTKTWSNILRLIYAKYLILVINGSNFFDFLPVNNFPTSLVINNVQLKARNWYYYVYFFNLPCIWSQGSRAFAGNEVKKSVNFCYFQKQTLNLGTPWKYGCRWEVEKDKVCTLINRWMLFAASWKYARHSKVERTTATCRDLRVMSVVLRLFWHQVGWLPSD